MNRTFSISVAAGLLAVLAGSMMTFTVPDDRQVVVTTFGSVSKVYDGGKEAGLKFKAPWPIQGYRSYPAGLRVTVTQPTDVTIGTDAVKMSLSVQWRITDAEAFFRNFDAPQKAEANLIEQAKNAQGNILGGASLEKLLGAGAGQDPLRGVTDRIRADLAERNKGAGLAVEGVGIRRLQFVAATSGKVIEQMNERNKGLAQATRSEGETEAKRIRNEARTTSDVILAFAGKRADEIRTQGEGQVADLYKVFAADQDLAVFLQRVRSFERTCGANTTFILDAQSDPVLRTMIEAAPAAAPAANPAANR